MWTVAGDAAAAVIVLLSVDASVGEVSFLGAGVETAALPGGKKQLKFGLKANEKGTF